MPVSFRDFLRARFEFPIRKLPVHLGLGCPHMDKGGCFYCDNNSFIKSDFARLSARDQIEKQIAMYRKKGFSGRFIVYFQSQTNTNAPLDRLREYYSPVHEFKKDVIGLSIATRPDCIDEEKLDLLESFSQDFMVWLELGLQSANDNALEFINRGHTCADFERAMDMTMNKNILVCAHIILGLPLDDMSDTIMTAELLKKYRIHGVKIHHLQITKGTPLERMFLEGKVKVLTIEEYIERLKMFVSHLHKEVVLHRLIGDIHRDYLVAPVWDKNYVQRLARRAVFGER